MTETERLLKQANRKLRAIKAPELTATTDRMPEHNSLTEFKAQWQERLKYSAELLKQQRPSGEQWETCDKSGNYERYFVQPDGRFYCPWSGITVERTATKGFVLADQLQITQEQIEQKRRGIEDGKVLVRTQESLQQIADFEARTAKRSKKHFRS